MKATEMAYDNAGISHKNEGISIKDITAKYVHAGAIESN